jgi:hypothetical protein
MNRPRSRERMIAAIAQANPAHLIVNPANVYSVLNQEDTDFLFDHLEAHFEPASLSTAGLLVNRPATLNANILFKRRPRPIPVEESVATLPGPITLNAANGFSAEFPVPPDIGFGYVEIRERFFYPTGLHRRFSLPLAYIFMNGEREPAELERPGRHMIRNTPEGGVYRIWIYPGVRRLRMTVLFFGALNLEAGRIELGPLTFHRYVVLKPPFYYAAFVKWRALPDPGAKETPP